MLSIVPLLVRFSVPLETLIAIPVVVLVPVIDPALLTVNRPVPIRFKALPAPLITPVVVLVIVPFVN